MKIKIFGCVLNAITFMFLLIYFYCLQRSFYNLYQIIRPDNFCQKLFILKSKRYWSASIMSQRKIQVQKEQFKSAFEQFIKPYQCHSHKQHPTFVCIDANCKQKGLICSVCLTIHGGHKNHDSIEINEFMGHCLQAFAKDFKKDQMSQLIRKIDETYEELLKMLTDFHQSYSNIIKNYISKKNDLHNEKESFLFTQNSLQQFKQCKFKSIDDMNKTLNILISRMSSKLQVDELSQQKNLEKTNYYFEDLNYEVFYIGKELRNLETKLKQLLNVKESTPVVLNLQPTFNSPKFYQNEEIIYLGQTKVDRPHGKGMCYFKNTHKIIYGDFHNGQLEGQGQLYFATGDYYVGQFKFDKKQGRGIYKWTGKESNLYEGQFKAGKRNGRGTFWWADGSWYEGQFKDGVQSGFGVLYREAGTKEYEGMWHNGMFDGKGTQYFDNGQRYEGLFKQDKFHGQGVFYKDDSIIYGVWKDNQLSVVNMVKSILSQK